MGKALDTKPSNFKFDPQNPHGRRQLTFPNFPLTYRYTHTPTPHKHAHNNTLPQKKRKKARS